MSALTWIKILGAIAIAALAIHFVFSAGSNKAEVACLKETNQTNQQEIRHIADDSKASGAAHQQSVVARNTAKENIYVQTQHDRDSVVRGTSDDGLRAGAAALADAVRRANGVV